MIDDTDRLRTAMRRIASSVGILATDGASGRAGVTVSSLCSLSLDPPSVLCCLHSKSRALEVLLANGVFTANFLAADQSAVADVFAGRVSALNENRFSIGEWQPMVTGAPALVGAICSFDCQIAAAFEFGTHKIVAGRIMDLQTGQDRPLMYFDQSYRQLSAIQAAAGSA
jgi:flavin reductase (DIM6/NTAB) family NADH-FMN oxidoreductase RutF